MYPIDLLKFNVLSFLKDYSKLDAVICEQSCTRKKHDLIVNFGQSIGGVLLEQTLSELLIRSTGWEINITCGTIENNKLLLNLNRKHAFYVIFNLILNSEKPYGYREFSDKSVAVTLLKSETTHLTAYRQLLLCSIVKNLLIVSGCNLRENAEMNFVLTTKISHSGIYIAPVRCQETQNDITLENYLRLRENDIKSIAEHKYWDSNRDSEIKILAAASVAIDLIANKHSNVVKLNANDECAAGTREMSNKGAAFLLYNVARLSSIEKKYEDKLNDGLFPALPFLKDIDFSLLSQQEEWHLLFNFIMDYPSVLSRSIANIEENRIGQHHLCTFLFKFCQIFSMYYRRYRILQEPKSHLLPIVFARLYLAKTINKVLKQALQILNISLLESM